MRAAFVIFDGMTALDFVGVYDPLGRPRTMGVFPDFEWTICAITKEVVDDRVLRFLPNVVGEPLGRYDLLVVPGGHATRAMRHNATFIIHFDQHCFRQVRAPQSILAVQATKFRMCGLVYTEGEGDKEYGKVLALADLKPGARLALNLQPSKPEDGPVVSIIRSGN